MTKKLTKRHDSPTIYQIGVTEILLLMVGLSAFIFIKTNGLDFVLADAIYGHFKWQFKDAFVTDQLLHRFGRYMVILTYLILLTKLASKLIKAEDPEGAYNLMVLLITIVLCVIIIALLKRVFNVDCPWDLVRYGGDKPYFPLFHSHSNNLASAHCFPASHSSVGFSWMALFFFFKISQHKHKYKALAGVIVIGLIFGFAQQLRGAHFISHDIASFIICLFTAIVVYSLAYRKAKPPRLSLAFASECSNT